MSGERTRWRRCGVTGGPTHRLDTVGALWWAQSRDRSGAVVAGCCRAGLHVQLKPRCGYVPGLARGAGPR